MVENFEVARILEEVGDLLELQGGNPFRVRAYRSAARVVRDLTEPVAGRLDDDASPLTDLPGIGADLAGKIATIARTGDLPLRKELEKKIPRGLLALLGIPGLGPKRALLLYERLGVDSKEALRKAIREHRVRALAGFGEKTEANLERALEHLEETSRRYYLSEARAYAASLERHLRSIKGVAKVVAAGSLRRGKDTVGDLDFIVCGDAAKAMDGLSGYESVDSILARGDTKMSARLRNGLQVDVRVVPESSFGAALVYFTGSKAHNLELRRRAQEQGLKINEYGVYRGKRKIAGGTEAEVYRAVHLPWIPPELREARGEIGLALEGKLPRLVEVGELRGDLHMHTVATDGRGTIEEMIAAAVRRGYEYVAITDHSKRVTMARGLDAKRVRAQWKAIDRLNAKARGIRVLKGIELDILDGGRLDLPDRVLQEADWVVASVHYNQKQSQREMTRRVIAAIKSPYVSAIGHPTGRILGHREELRLDLDAVFKAAADYGCALEANGQPGRMDLDDVRIRNAKALGVKFVLTSDAHSIEELSFIENALIQARRAGLEAEDILNSLSLERFLGAARAA